MGDDNTQMEGGVTRQSDTFVELGQPSAGEVTRAGMGSMIHIYSEGDKPRGNGMKYEDSRVIADSITAPSSSNTLGQGMNKVDIPDLRAAKLETECKFNKKTKVSMRHECEARSYEVTRKKWKWIDKQKKYGFVTQKCVKWKCMRAASMSVQVHYSANPELRKQPAEVLNECDNVQTEGLGMLKGDSGTSIGSTRGLKEKVF